MFEEKIIEEIIEAWKEDQLHPHRKRKPLPDPKDIRAILEMAFLASLRREEEKPIRFSITLLEKELIEEEQQSSNRQQLIMAFNNVIGFDENSITKIANAFDYRTTSIIVIPKDESKSGYEICGVMFYGLSLHSFREIPVSYYGLSLSRPDELFVVAVSPGSLIIAYGDQVMGRFLSGKFIKASPDPFVRAAMGQYMKRIVECLERYKKFGNKYWYYYTDTINYLVSEISGQGNGGTVVLIPKEKIIEYQKHIDARFVFEDKLKLDELIEEIINEREARKKGEYSSIFVLERCYTEESIFWQGWHVLTGQQ